MMTLSRQAQILADYLPGGRLFAAKNIAGSNFRNLLRGLAGEALHADDLIETYKNDINPASTVSLIDEWEAAVGIPDGCFDGSGTIDERRTDVLIKLASLGVQTADDFVALGAILGIDIEVKSGKYFSTFPLVLPFILFDTVAEARFTIVVSFPGVQANSFPLTFPITFGDDATAKLRCLFTKLKPANCNIIFRQVL